MIINASMQVSAYIYADDTMFYVGKSDVSEALETINNTVNLFWEWCSMNRLTINLQKSKAMLFFSKKQYIHDNLKERTIVKINETYLETVNTYKYLGVILNDT